MGLTFAAIVIIVCYVFGGIGYNMTRDKDHTRHINQQVNVDVQVEVDK